MNATDIRLLARARSRRGFTLIELLAVIAIIVILASLVLAVSSSVARASEERSTRATLEVLNMAAEEFERTLDRRVSYRSGAVTGGITQDAIPSTANPIKYDVDSAPAAPPAASGVAAWTNLAIPYSNATGGLPAFSTQPFRRTAELLWAITEAPSSAAIMQKLPEAWFRGVRPSAGSLPTALRHCVDAWDTPIIAVFPGRDATSAELAANNANIIDPDGTVKCDSEWGVPTTQGGMRVSCKDRRILFMSAGNDSRFTVQSGSTYTPSNDNLSSYEP